MTNKLKPTYFGLEDYKLNLTGLKTLNRKVYVEIYFVHTPHRFGSYRKLSKMTTKERTRYINDLRKACYQKLTQIDALQKLDLIGTKVRPRGWEGWIYSGDLYALRSNPHIENIFVKKVRGLRQIPAEKKVPAWQWYAVESHIVIQIEGRNKGNQTHEKRVSIVRARSTGEAERICRKVLRSEGEPYLNCYGEYVRWRLIEIVNVDPLIDDPGEDDVVEVYSKLFSKRFKMDFAYKHE